ncbi:MAG: DNA-binding SARP family transcriptional activator, partial [Myxococcota bacterium]
MLAYLIVARSGSLHRRDTILAMFWPEHGAERGRNALSKVIHHLRRALGPEAILTEGDQIGISREHVWCDVTAFEEALASGRTEDALALYRGDLLEGFHISGAAEFDHWSEVERSRLRRSAVASAWELASIAEQDGDGVRATHFARQAVEWAPRDESGLRRLLTLLQRRGHPAEALEVFEAFSQQLRRDYEIEPSGPTLELVEAIRDGSLPSDLAGTRAVALEPGAPAPETGSPEVSTAREVAGPHQDPRSRWRLVAAAVAVGLVGVFALSRSNLAPFRGGEDVSETPRVLVTEFDDRTQEDLATVVAGALRVDLSQSRAFDLVERAEIAKTLELMGLESSATVSAGVGREIALRDGLDALVDGAVASAGTGYIITAAIRAGSGGRTIGSFRESADGPDQVIAAIDRLSIGIREALGESVDTIRASLPLERVTTPSLEALTQYTRAVRAFNQFDDRPEATRLLQRAVALDPGFAMAWRMLGVALQNEADQS